MFIERSSTKHNPTVDWLTTPRVFRVERDQFAVPNAFSPEPAADNRHTPLRCNALAAWPDSSWNRTAIKMPVPAIAVEQQANPPVAATDPRLLFSWSIGAW